MGITDQKQKPVKSGYVVGPRLIKFMNSFSENFVNGMVNESTSAKDYIMSDITKRVVEGKEKYNQYLYTNDGICKFKQASEELDDAIHYIFSNLILQVMDKECDILLDSPECKMLRVKVEVLSALLSNEFVSAVRREKGNTIFKDSIIEPHKEDCIFDIEDLN